MFLNDYFRIFIVKQMLNFIKYLFAFIEIVWFLSFILFMWCILFSFLFVCILVHVFVYTCVSRCICTWIHMETKGQTLVLSIPLGTINFFFLFFETESLIGSKFVDQTSPRCLLPSVGIRNACHHPSPWACCCCCYYVYVCIAYI